VQQAWAAEQVSQCGYCEPGMIMALSALLRTSQNPLPEQLAAIGNICRCGIGPRVLKAVARAGAAAAGPQILNGTIRPGSATAHPAKRKSEEQ
jgi:isoquinoline 1-oxidoreductase alpha subunit